MSFTAAGFVFIYGLLLLLAFRNPIFGLYAYLWGFYNPPPMRWWGEGLHPLRWEFIAAIVTLISLRFFAPSIKKIPWHANSGIWLLLVFSIWVYAQYFWAVDPTWHMEGASLFGKYVFLFYLIQQVVSDQKNLERFCWAHVIGCAIFGWIAFSEASGGRFERVGGSGVNDSNSLGMHLGTGLAIAGFMALGFEGTKRLLVIGLIPLILNGIILTGSRGAIVAVICSGFVAWYMTAKTQRNLFYKMGILALGLFVLLAQDDYFWDRMGTMTPKNEYNEEVDDSASSRIEIIKFGWEMAKDNPFGAGYRGHFLLSTSYMPEKYTEGKWYSGRSAHNSLMNVLVEHGFPGLILFLCLVAWGFFTLFKLKELDKLGLSSNITMYRGGVATALTIWFVHGMFTDFSRAEVAIWLLALIPSLKHLSISDIKEKMELSESPEEGRGASSSAVKRLGAQI